MISNEKQKVKKAREADGSEDGVAATPSGKVRVLIAIGTLENDDG